MHKLSTSIKLAITTGLFAIRVMSYAQAIDKTFPVIPITEIMYDGGKQAAGKENANLIRTLDSLWKITIADTSRFSVEDLIQYSRHTINSKPYSPLFVIDGLYSYKLDIINGQQVAEFVSEFRDYKKIDSVSFVNPAIAESQYGRNGVKGAVFLRTKAQYKVNYQLAGLNVSTKNNFHQHIPGKIRISD